ncbi:hypothetical protein [Neorhizobium sp. NCHU2750]|uniref:hypothetical protein n=1 Tax=Neorhizobium sp. NCHU2750 TaxID=1825976 RepID=UPI000E7529C5|nr:hypothetical protein NCHU2750_07040 [Neorhizobium sp. NCHU2750]
MAEEKDRYAEARDGLRETAKWYTASLGAVGAALAGGLSFGILPDLSGENLRTGLFVGAGVFAAILIAVTKISEILFPQPFSEEKLDDEAVKQMIAPYLVQLMPYDMPTIQDARAKRAPGNSPADRQRARAVLEKVTSFAAFLDLRVKVRETNMTILYLFVAACAGIGYLSYLQGMAKKAEAEGYVPITFSPGPGWTSLTTALAAACPTSSGLISAEGKADSPFEDWWTVRLKDPQACSGASFAVPKAVIGPAPPRPKP